MLNSPFPHFLIISKIPAHKLFLLDLKLILETQKNIFGHKKKFLTGVSRHYISKGSLQLPNHNFRCWNKHPYKITPFTNSYIKIYKKNLDEFTVN